MKPDQTLVDILAAVAIVVAVAVVRAECAVKRNDGGRAGRPGPCARRRANR